MRKMAMWVMVLFFVFSSPAWAMGLEKSYFSDNISSAATQKGPIRSADPCKKLVQWQDEIVSPEFWNGLAEHHYSPAAYLAFSAKENGFNLVSLLVWLELSQGLISTGKTWNGDFEYRLLEAANYGSQQADRHRWYGFVPQCVGMTYQFFLFRTRDNLTFRQASLKYANNEVSWSRFRTLYFRYALLLNFYLGTRYDPMPNSNGHYLDFQVTSQNQARVITGLKKFLKVMGSPLANNRLFQEPAGPSVIDYGATEKFCQ